MSTNIAFLLPGELQPIEFRLHTILNDEGHPNLTLDARISDSGDPWCSLLAVTLSPVDEFQLRLYADITDFPDLARQFDLIDRKVDHGSVKMTMQTLRLAHEESDGE